MPEQSTKVEKDTAKTNGISRTKLYDYFIDSVLKDVEKCVRFAATFVGRARITEVVDNVLSQIIDN